MALKRGLDQMSIWALAVVATGAVFGAGYSVTHVIAKRAEAAEDHASEDSGEARAEGRAGDGREEEAGGEGHRRVEAEGHEGTERSEAKPHGGEEHHAGDGHDGEGATHESGEGSKARAKAREEEGAREKGRESREHGEGGKEKHAVPAHGGESREHEHGSHEEQGQEGADVRPHAGAAYPLSESRRNHAADAHWAYGGSEGPEHWGSLSEEYALCQSGRRQSPVDLSRPTLNTKLLPLRFNYKDTKMTLRNDGRLLHADVERGSSLSFEGQSYDLVRVDFHAPSEHHVEGAPFDFETQLVHEDTEGHTLVVALFYEHTGGIQKNPGLAALWDHLPKIGEPPSEPRLVNPEAMLPSHRYYYHYEGSLTTPPCTEGVRWIVLQEPQGFSEKQEEIYLASLDRTAGTPARPVQPLHGRKVVRFSR